MSELLKSAIADAKAVRETALLNAKMALEEAFTPQLQSMLSAKLREEDDEELEDELEELEDEPEELEDEVEEQEELEDEPEELEDEPEEFEDEVEEQEELEDEPEELEDEPEELEDEVEEQEELEDLEEFEDELDLESILRELEEELEDEPEEFEDEVEETFEIDESLFEEDDEEEVEPVESEELDKTKAELDEYKEAVKFLKDKLHEVNILNAKLLFTNKLFKEFVLDNNQKLKIVETFDRAQTVREIKLVYATLAESFGSREIPRKSRLKEAASTRTASTKPSKESRKVITEEAQVAERFKKLAGLIK